MGTEFKGTKGEWYCVEYAGNIFIQDSEFYEDSDKCNLLDFDYVGKEIAEANAKLISCAPELLNALQKAIDLLYGTTEFEVIENYRKKVDDFEQIIKKATK